MKATLHEASYTDTPDTRRREIAALLALGLHRLREYNGQHKKHMTSRPDQPVGLAFSGDQSVHVTSSTTR